MALITVVTLKKGNKLCINLWDKDLYDDTEEVVKLKKQCYKSLVLDAFTGRPGVSMTVGLNHKVQIFDGNFKMEQLGENDVYLTSDSWRKEDLKRFFEDKNLDNQWFAAKLDDIKIQEAHKIVTQLIHGHNVEPHFECLGWRNNGYSIIWTHPDKERYHKAFKNLAAIPGVVFGIENDIPQFLAWEAEYEGSSEAGPEHVINQANDRDVLLF